MNRRWQRFWILFPTAFIAVTQLHPARAGNQTVAPNEKWNLAGTWQLTVGYFMVPPSNDNHASVATLVANNPPPANQQLRIFAKTGDTIDNIPNVKVGSWGGNLIDDNGSIAYLGFYNGYYEGVFRDNKLVLGKEQIIEGYKVSEIKGFFLFKNGHLDICAELYDPKTLQTKYIVTRNGKKIFDSDTIDNHVVSLGFFAGEEKGKDFYSLNVKDSHYKDHRLETDGLGAFLPSNPNHLGQQKIINYAMAPNDPILKAINEQFPELGVSSGRRDVSGFQKSASGAEAIILNHGLGGKPEDGRVIMKAGGGEQQPSQKIYLTRATTTDAKSVTVDYTVEATNSGKSSQLIHFEIYRSSTEDADHPKEKIGQQDIKVGENDIPNSTNSSPDKHRVQLNLPVDSLKPNTAAPYVVVVATYNGKKSTTYFRKWLLGVVSHGFDRLNAEIFFGYISIGSGYYGIPKWESNMANNLNNIEKYDDVISFDWSNTCALAKPDMAIQAGANLSKQITQLVLTHRQHDGDVVDIHLIGHSRGTVVVTQALQHLSSASPSFEGGYIELTLLDPHPASNKFGQWADFGRDKDGKVTSLAAIAANTTTGFQSKADDPAVKIPLNVKKIDVWYQHTLTKYLIDAPDQENAMNLWGIIDAIQNDSGLPIQWHELTAPGIGHNQIPDVL